MQQSAAFKILKTRLKAVPSYSFNGEQPKRMPSGDHYQFLHNMPDGYQTNEDGNVTEDGRSSYNGINFAARLQQFHQMQNQHRAHTKAKAKSRNRSTSLQKVTGLFILHVYFLFLFNVSHKVLVEHS